MRGSALLAGWREYPKDRGKAPRTPHVRYVAGQFFRIRPYSSDSLCAICCGAVLSNTAVLFRFPLCDMLRGSSFEYGRTLPIPFVRYVAGQFFRIRPYSSDSLCAICCGGSSFEYGRTLPIPFVLHVMGQLAGAPLAICNFVVVALREFRCFCGGVLCFL